MSETFEVLTPAQARVLGALIEKQATTPESYPLTLNALQLACNQKTSREPVMELDAGEVGAAARALEARDLVRLQMGSRADRWEQRLDKQLELAPPQLALLGLLLLRSAQTPGELLARSGRLYAFDDGEQVRHHLERLVARGLAAVLPRQSGQREERYMHLLLGDEALQQAAQAAPASASSGGLSDRVSELEARIATLEARLAALEADR